MIGPTNDLKVLRSVVGTNVVEMMDVLPRSQSTAKLSFHDVAVLKHLFSVNEDDNVAVRADKAATMPVCPALPNAHSR
jgi:hypothetical protein